MPTNAERVAWAELAIAAFTKATGQARTYPQAAEDLIVDLLHYLRSNGHTPATTLARLYAVFRSEEIAPVALAPEPTVTVSECGLIAGLYESRSSTEFFNHSLLAPEPLIVSLQGV